MFGDFPYSQALEEVNYTWRRVLAMTLTLIPTNKAREIIQTSLGKSREIRGKDKVRTKMCIGPLNCKIKIRTCIQAINIVIRGLSMRREDQPYKTW